MLLNDQMSPKLHLEADKAVSALRMGHVILYPTDTIWGLGCDIENEYAVKRIHEIKERPADKPLIILVDSIETLKRYIRHIHPRVETLLIYHDQPLTIVYQASSEAPPYLCTSENTIAIRVTLDPFCRALIKGLGRPITSTSANISTQAFPTSYEHIESLIKEKTDYIVDPTLDPEEERQPSVMATFNHKGELDFIRL